jgi:NitT/TauT family transport system substrate-binding protein
MMRILGAAAIALLLALSARSAAAADTIRVARSGLGIAFAPADVGNEAGIWQALGIELRILDITGTKIEQALTAGEADVGLGAGVALGFRAKGVPTVGVAALAGPPYSFTLVVRPDSPIRGVADLKGKSVGVTTAGSVTYWLVRELSRQQGWGTNGIQTVTLGDDRSRTAALKNGEIDANLTTTLQAFDGEAHGQSRLLMNFGDIVKDFHTFVINAPDRFVAEKPELLTRFLKGWFQTVAYMKTHRDVGIRVVAKTFGVSEAAVGRSYDEEMKMMSDDGAFSPAAIDVIRHSLVELGILDTLPEAKAIYTDRFVPVKF